jgi:MFS superfamily sulfate permease-like transporter
VIVVVTVLAGVAAGLLLGACLSSAITFAMISHSQERMQRKLGYWQAEAARAQAEAAQLAGQVAPHRRLPPGPDHEPWEW